MTCTYKQSKQGIRRAVFLLTAIVMVFSLILPEGLIASTVNAADDIGSLIVDKSNLWINGIDTQSGEQITVKDGDSVELAIEWRINNNEDYLSYQTVIGHTGIDFKSTEGELYADGDHVGKYIISTDSNGVTTFTVELTEQAKEKSNISGGVLLQGEISVDLNNDIVNGSDVTVGAGDKSCTVTYDDGSGHGKVTLEKSNGDIVYDNGKYYVDYTITATVNGMISEFTLSDDLPAGMSVTGSVKVTGGSTAQTEFPLTIAVGNKTKSDSTSVTVTYRTEITSEAFREHAALEKGKGREFTNTATADYKDDVGKDVSVTAKSNVLPQTPVISKTSKQYKKNENSGGEELEWVTAHGQVIVDNKNILAIDGDYYALEWTITLPVKESGDVDVSGADAAKVNQLLRSIRDTMYFQNTALINQDWAPYDSRYFHSKKGTSTVTNTDALSQLLHQYNGDLSKLTDTDCARILSSYSGNLVSTENGKITLTYKTVIVRKDLIVPEVPGTTKKIENNIVVEVDGVPTTATASGEYYLGIGPVKKDILLDASTSANVKDTQNNDWTSNGNSNSLKSGKDLSDAVIKGRQDGIIEVPYRIKISYDGLVNMYNSAAEGSDIIITDTLETATVIKDSNGDYRFSTSAAYNKHHYIDPDDFWDGFSICLNTTIVPISVFADKFAGMELITTTVGDETYCTGWKLTIKKNSVYSQTTPRDFLYQNVIQPRQDLYLTYYTKVKMVQDENGNYIFDPQIANYKFLNTVGIQMTVDGKTIIGSNDFTLDYTPQKDEPVIGNISKSSVSGAINYSDVKDIKLTDETKNQLGWLISIPVSELKAGDKLVIKDTPSDGHTFVKQVKGDMSTGYGVYGSTRSSSSIKYEDYKFEDYSITYEGGGASISITVTQQMLDKIQALRANSIRIYCATRYSDSYLAQHYNEQKNQKVRFTNSADVTYNGKELEPASASTDIATTPIADKKVLSDESTVWNEVDKIISAQYMLDINYSGEDLDSASDTLIVTDTMADVMTLDESTVRFTDDDGNAVAGCTFKVNGNTITFTIPDGKHVKISYTVKITVDPIFNPFWGSDATNSFRINGLDLDTQATSTDLSAFNGLIRAWVNNTVGDITVRKYYIAPQGRVNLKDAQFVLRRVYDNNSVCYPADDQIKDIMITDDNGEILVEDLPLDIIYKLEEIKVPDGYADEHKREYYFVLQGNFGVKDPREIENPTAEEKAIADKLTAALGTEPIPVFEDADVLDYENVKVVDIEITKKWVDHGYSDYRPDTLDITLRRTVDGVTWHNVTFDRITWTKTGDTWKGTIKDLRVYDENGKEYTYEVSEKQADNYREPAYSGEYKQNITNTLDTVELEVQKNWLGDEGHEDYRPNSITVQVLADGEVLEGKVITLDAAGNWYGSIANLPKYDNAGKEIAYSVKELAVTGYSSGTPVANGTAFVINNTFETVDLTVKKNWKGDAGYTDSYRPASIKVQVLADGVALDGVILTLEGDDWSGTVYDLPKYNKNGKAIVYTVKEIKVAGYESDSEKSGDNSFIINNTFETVDLTITKLWSGDDNYADAYRPEGITVHVLANGEELDGVTLTLSKDSWAGMVKNLPKYDTNGKEITYTVKEAEVTAYKSSVKSDKKNVFVINNTFETVDVSASKKWIGDEKYADVCRPDSITVQVLANGKELEGVTMTLCGDSWSDKVTGLAKFDTDGSEITYTVKEIKVAGYTSQIQNPSKYDFVINNTLETVGVSGTKIWQGDENFAQAIRPKELTIVLYANDDEFDRTQCLAQDNWKFSFTDLPKYDINGKQISYTISEQGAPEGYTCDIKKPSDQTGEIKYSVYNTFAQELTDITVVKTWNDNDNAYNTRPESITVKLLANGEQVAQATITAAQDAENEWTYTFKDLPKYSSYKIKDGKIVGDKAIVYTAIEDDVENYDKTQDGLSIRNTLHNEEVTVSGSKIWKDFGNKYNTRPDTITVVLYDSVNGKLDVQPVWDTTTDPDNWKYSFNNLPKYTYVNGERIELEYSVSEEPVQGYTSTINGTDITNTLDTTTGEVNKLDKDSGEEISGAKLELYDELGDIVAQWTSAKGATWSLTDLIPGKKYTIKEAKAPDGYLTADDTVFTVDKDGNITLVSGKDSYVGEDSVLVINDTEIKTESDSSKNDGNTPQTGYVKAVPYGIIGILLLFAAFDLVKKKTDDDEN